MTRKLALCPGNARGRRRLRRLYNKRVVLDIESLSSFERQAYAAHLLFPATDEELARTLTEAGCVKVTQLQDSVVYEFLSVYEPT